MSTWRSRATVPGSPTLVLELLTQPDAIARWAPVPFELLALNGNRLEAGSRARVAGQLGARSVEFAVDVLEASPDRLELAADGPISLDVRYLLRAAGADSEIDASVSVHGRGLFGRVLAKATDALLAAGALRISLERIARELQPTAGAAA